MLDARQKTSLTISLGNAIRNRAVDQEFALFGVEITKLNIDDWKKIRDYSEASARGFVKIFEQILKTKSGQ